MGRYRSPSSLLPAQNASEMRRHHAALKQTARLHNLMANIVDGRGCVVHTADQRIFVGDLAHSRKNFANLNSWYIGLDRLVRTSNLRGRFRLHVPGIQLAGSTHQEELNDIQ